MSSVYIRNLRRVAPQMAAVYERTFRKPLRERVVELIQEYPNVEAPNWLSWEGYRITNIETTAKLRLLLAALEESSNV